MTSIEKDQIEERLTTGIEKEDREMLYQHDGGVARMRRMLSQQVKQQLAAEDMSSVRTAV